MNSMMSTCFMYYPKPKRTFQSIKQTSRVLFDYIQTKEAKCYISTHPQNYDINEAALDLGFKVTGEPMNKNKGNMAEVDLSLRSNDITLLSLAYYGNQLSVYFSEESYLAHSMMYLMRDQVDLKNF